MSHNTLRYVAFLFLMSLAFCAPCSADGGVLLGMLIYPNAFWFLVPVILIESFVFKSGFGRLPWRTNLKVMTLSNLASTIAGIPILFLEALLLWGIYATRLKTSGLSKTYTLLHATVLNYHHMTENSVLRCLFVLFGVLVLMIPYFLISVLVEKKINLRLLKNLTPERAHVGTLTWKANIFSYAFMTLALTLKILIATEFYGA